MGEPLGELPIQEWKVELKKTETTDVQFAIDSYMLEGVPLQATLEALKRENILTEPYAAKMTFDATLKVYNKTKGPEKEKIALLGIALNTVIPKDISFFPGYVEKFKELFKGKEQEIRNVEVLARQVFPKEEKQSRVTQAAKWGLKKLSSAKQKIAKAIKPQSAKIEKSGEKVPGAGESKIQKAQRIIGQLVGKLKQLGIRKEASKIPLSQAPNTIDDVQSMFSSLHKPTDKMGRDQLVTDLYAGSPIREKLATNCEFLATALKETTRAIHDPHTLQSQTTEFTETRKAILQTLTNISDRHPELGVSSDILNYAKGILYSQAPETTDVLQMMFKPLYDPADKMGRNQLVTDLYAGAPLREKLATDREFLETALMAATGAMQAAHTPESQTAQFIDTTRQILQSLLNISDMNPALSITPSILEDARKAAKT